MQTAYNKIQPNLKQKMGEAWFTPSAVNTYFIFRHIVAIFMLATLTAASAFHP